MSESHKEAGVGGDAATDDSVRQPGRNEWLTPVTFWWTGLVVALGLTVLIFYEGIVHMVDKWASEEYSYAYLIPPLVAFFIWQKKNELAAVHQPGSWAGFAAVVFALFMFVAGDLGTLYPVIQYGLILAVAGGALALLGWAGFRLVGAPLAMLLFLVPLPQFFYQNLSQSLQLLSSKWGVWIIRQFDISVHLEGNVIDLGSMQLQVVEACSGLRYLFPLMAIGFVAAYLFRAPFWKKVVLFLSTIPITVLMNSLRIGLTGVAVEFMGKEVAGDFLHYFEGWVVFMLCLVLLVGEMWLLTRIGGDRRPLGEVFNLELPGPVPTELVRPEQRLPTPFIGVVVLLAGTAAAMTALPERQEIIPERLSFEKFPMKLDGWQGHAGRLEPMILDALDLNDYLKADYVGPAGERVALYVAWYESQRKGQSAHSPRACLPGGGWEIRSLDQRSVPDVVVNGAPLRVNRTLIQKGDSRQLVYYWFQQRGRVITSEYLVKWYLFVDALTRQRTDGALVRLITVLPDDLAIEAADAQLAGFAKVLAGELERYVPN
jgi:exosortase D (VPLPA-CTERM-specific)